ncbi:hypothetical protein BTUL_0084g00150 [Botrytis tulipae]|uniref:Uncharacterized protein n=1 Tax=Botrytis tulipae TaxID=87230 RepID=A0A4Z1EUV5_9HELO|nr:hypothetical protein BTUL_0084g00150 [Botrytis tulipae]
MSIQKDAKAKKEGSDKTRPWRNRRIVRPPHPEKRDGDEWRSEHGKPESFFRGQFRFLSVDGAQSFEIFLRPVVDQRDETRGETEPDGNTEECESGESLAEIVRFPKYVCVSVEKGEEDNVYDGEIEREEHDDGFARDE